MANDLAETAPQDTIFMAAGLKDAAGLGFMVMVLQVLMTAISIPLMEPWRDAKRCVQGRWLQEKET